MKNILPKAVAAACAAAFLSGCGASTPQQVATIVPKNLGRQVASWPVPLLSGKLTRVHSVIINPLTTQPKSVYASLIRNALNTPAMGVSSNWNGLTVPVIWLTDGRTTYNIPMYRSLTNNASLNTAVPVSPAKTHQLVLDIMQAHYLLLSPSLYSVIIQRIPVQDAAQMANNASSMVENLDMSSQKPTYLVIWVGSTALPSDAPTPQAG